MPAQAMSSPPSRRASAVSFRASTRRKNSESERNCFAERNERFRDGGRKSLESLGREIREFRRIVYFQWVEQHFVSRFAACDSGSLARRDFRNRDAGVELRDDFPVALGSSQASGCARGGLRCGFAVLEGLDIWVSALMAIFVIIVGDSEIGNILSRYSDFPSASTPFPISCAAEVGASNALPDLWIPIHSGSLPRLAPGREVFRKPAPWIDRDSG
jgi:hypothetical protein